MNLVGLFGERVRPTCVAASFLLIGNLAPASIKEIDRQDYLYPVIFDADLKYRELLNVLLFVTVPDYGRMLTQPSSASEGESAVVVSSEKSGRDPEQAVVTYTQAERNLWDALTYGGSEDAAKQIKIARLDASIPKSAAIAVGKAWAAMLHRIKPRKNEGPVSVDYTEVEFDLLSNAGEALYGQLELVNPGRYTQALYEIGKLLIVYCEAEPERRKALGKQIENNANRLVDQLQRGKS